jgi:transposase
MASLEVLAGPERRRRWSMEQKQAIVAAAFEPGAVVRDVARHADVTPSLIYRWRRDLRAAANGFAQVLVAPAGDGVTAPPPMPAIEIELAGNARIRIPASVPPALAAAVVEALARR